MRWLTVMMLASSCGPDVPPKNEACSQARRADMRNEDLERPEGGCHICQQGLVRRGIGETEMKYACDCDEQNCGYWSPAGGTVKWTSAGNLQYQEDLAAACASIPPYVSQLDCP